MLTMNKSALCLATANRLCNILQQIAGIMISIHQLEHGPKPFCSTFHWLILGRLIMEPLPVFESSSRNMSKPKWCHSAISSSNSSPNPLGLGDLGHWLNSPAAFWWSTASWCSRSSRARIWAACAASIRIWTCHTRVTRPYRICTCQTMGCYEETCNPWKRSLAVENPVGLMVLNRA